MGGTPENDIIYLSEIIVTNTETLTGKLIIDLPEATILSAIVLSNTGQTKFQDSFSCLDGRNEINLDLSQLKKGTYNAWIEVNGNTFIRTITIDHPQDNGQGLFSKVKSLFSF